MMNICFLGYLADRSLAVNNLYNIQDVSAFHSSPGCKDVFCNVMGTRLHCTAGLKYSQSELRGQVWVQGTFLLDHKSSSEDVGLR